MYPDVQLFIDGAWTDAVAGRKLVVINPATGEPAGKVAHAERARLLFIWRAIELNALRSCAADRVNPRAFAALSSRAAAPVDCGDAIDVPLNIPYPGGRM